jgi:hypothetical protein
VELTCVPPFQAIFVTLDKTIFFKSYLKFVPRITGMQWPNLEAGHSPPSGVDVKNIWVIVCSPVRLHGLAL